MHRKESLFFLIILVFHSMLFCWGGETHTKLAEACLAASDLAKSGIYFRLNLYAGSNTPLTNDERTKTALNWLQYGLKYEDDETSTTRSKNHFHNPLKPFVSAGLNDFGVHGDSLIYWSQSINDKQSDHPFGDSVLMGGGDQSWNKLNEYYYYALTAVTPESLSQNLAKMFIALGSQIHLIQDCAVPDHVRNDAHLLNANPFVIETNKYFGYFRCIEGWANENLNTVISFAQLPLIPNLDLSKNSAEEPTIISPKSLLIDANKYNGSPGEPSEGMEQGLAEFTNANFFSEDTMFADGFPKDDKHYFPYPAQSELIHDNSEMLKNGHWGYYYKKVKSGAKVNHLCRRGYAELKLDPLGLFKKKVYANFFDNECHMDYASMLIPRAVGYSAALINYLFRGSIEISLPTCAAGTQPPQNEGIYAFCANGENGFDRISLMAKNITPNEDMTSGYVKLVIRYRLCHGDPFQPGFTIDPKQYFIVVDYENEAGAVEKVSIPSDNPRRFEFNLSDTPLPVSAVDVSFSLVYRGSLGWEKENGVACGYKDVSEPTPIDFFNNTDRVCFNGHYAKWDDTALWDTVDINPLNGRIDCTNGAEVNITRSKVKPIVISFNGKAASDNNDNYFYDFKDTIEILPGKSFRIYIIANEYPDQLKYSLLVHAQSEDDPIHCHMVYFNDVITTGAITRKLLWNQNIGDYESLCSPLGAFRGISFFNLEYFDNNSVPEDSKCSILELSNNLMNLANDKNDGVGNPSVFSANYSSIIHSNQ